MNKQDGLGSIPQVPITIKRGGMFYLPFTYVDSTNTPVVLTGWNARLQIWGSPMATGTAIVDIGSYGTNISCGTIAIGTQVSITINSGFTKNLPNTNSYGWCEFHFIDSGYNDIPLFEGPVFFEAGGIR
jgi:hypothetical protein